MSHVRILTLITCLSGSLVLCAAEAGAPAVAGKGDSPDKGGLDRSGLDPTRLYSYVGAAHEQNTNNETGSDTSREVIDGQFAFEHFAVRASIPFFVRANPALGYTKDGFGDIAVGAAFAKEVKPNKMSFVVSLDSVLNTASDDLLGSNAVIIIPAAFVSSQLDENSRIIGGLRWSTDIYTENDVRDTNRLDLPVEWLHSVQPGFFVAAGGEVGREFEVERWAVSALGSVGMVVNQRHTFRLSLEVPVSSYSQVVDGRELSLDYAYNF